MSRALLRYVVMDRAGDVIEGAAVSVFRAGTLDPPDMFDARTGGSAITNPLLSDSTGRVVAWLSIPETVDLVVTDNGNTARRAVVPRTSMSWADYADTVQISDMGVGTLVAPRDEWASGVTYAEFDLVTHDGNTWLSLQDGNIAHTPASGLWWQLWAAAGANGGSVLLGPVAVTGNVNYTTTTYEDVLTIAPATVDPIILLATGMIGLVGSGAAGLGNPGGFWRVVDDLGNLIGHHQHWGVFTGASQVLTQSLHMRLPVTPDSTGRTYKLQSAIAAAYTGLTVRAYGLTATFAENAVKMEVLAP